MIRFSWIFPAAVFLLLFANFRFNVLKTVSQESFLVFQADSQALVDQKLFEVAGTGQADPARGFLISSKEMINHRLEATFPENAGKEGRLYRPQFGLQGMMAALIQSVLGTRPAVTIHILETLVALGTAGVVVFLLRGIQKRSGIWIASAAAVPFLFCPVLVLCGRNLYWVLPLLMLPLVATWRVYEARGLTPATLKFVFPMVALLSLAKCLCGYEYITCLCLGPSVALAAIWASQGYRGTGTYLKHAAALFAAVCLGFAAAMIIHVIYVSWVVGGLQEAASALTARATAHIAATDLESMPVQYQDGIVGRVRVITQYLTLPGVAIGAQVSFGNETYSFIAASFMGLFAFVVLCAGARMRNWRGWRLAAGPLLVVTGGMLASVSWLVAAKGHSVMHFHVNSLAFLPLILSLPLALFAAEPEAGDGPGAGD